MSASDEAAHEIPLAGGLMTSVVRVGDTVHRATGPWSPAVHALLHHLERAGFEGAPRLLGIDDRGREIQTYIEGVVPNGADPRIVTEAALSDVGRLIRRLHAATAKFRLPDGVEWHQRSLGGPLPHVVCHHDLSPRNTVFRDGRAVAFIDWDLANVEAPIHDLYHAAWEFVPLGSDDGCRREGWTELPDRFHRLRLLLDAYGLSEAERHRFAAGTAARVDLSASGIEQFAAAGHAPFQHLVEQGVPASIRQDSAWIRHRAVEIDAAIRR